MAGITQSPFTSLWPDSDPSVVAPVPEHDDLRAVTRAILQAHGSIDRVRAAAEAGTGGRTEVWRLLTSEVDVVGIAVPERLGGSGFGMRELGVVLEETGAALVTDPVLSSAVLGAQALVMADDAAHFQSLLSEVRAGSVFLTSWNGGARALDVTRSGRDLRVSGQLHRVLHGDVADYAVVPAREAAGEVLLLVDLSAASRTKLEVVDPTRRQADIVVGDASARLIAGPEASAVVRARLATLACLAVACEHAGIVGRLLDATVAYAATREQFGRPIGSFQVLKHRLADVLVARERCLSASRYAAALYDADPEAAAAAAVVAAVVCAESVLAAAHEAIQLHGGIGFTWEHAAHLYLRRALGDEGLFGSAHEHRLTLASLLELP